MYINRVYIYIYIYIPDIYIYTFFLIYTDIKSIGLFTDWRCILILPRSFSMVGTMAGPLACLAEW